MRPDLEHYYLIDQYLENKLKGEELSAFENQLLHDETFAQEVQEQRMLNDYILESELKSVRTQIEKDLYNIQNPSFFKMHWKWIGVGFLSISSLLYYVIPSDVTEPGKESMVRSAVNRIPEPAHTPEKLPENNVQQHIQSSKGISKPEIVTENKAPLSIDSVHTITPEQVVTAPIVAQTNISTFKNESKPEEITKTIDCSLTKINFTVTTETSCEKSETGSIHIEKISGGTEPYTFALNNKKIKEKNIFELAAGTYEVKISDRNGCSTQHKATVFEKNCTPTIEQGAKFNINPTIGETCTIPFNSDKRGTVTIYNRVGKIIYRITNPSSDYVEWSGTDGYGSIADVGLYVYIIEYMDGTKITGEVNIIR